MMAEQKPSADRETILAHLRLITKRWEEVGEDVRLELRAIDPDRKITGRAVHVSRFSWDEDGLSMAADHAEAMNRYGFNMYPAINPIKGSVEIKQGSGASDEDIAAAFYCWADCDDETSGSNVRAFPGPKYTFAVTTGTKPCPRPHIYWELTEPIRDMHQFKDLQERIAARFQSDNKVTNFSRIMRLAGTVNHPAEHKRAKGYITELCTLRTEYDEPRAPVPLDRLLTAFPRPAERAQETGGLHIDLGPQAMDRAAAEAAALTGEAWHDNMIRLVASYVAKGLRDPEIHALTDRLTLPGYTIEDTRKEVQQAIEGARNKGFAPEQQAAKSFDHAPSEGVVAEIWQRSTSGKTFATAEERAALDNALRAEIEKIEDPGLRHHVAADLRHLRECLIKNNGVPPETAKTWKVQTAGEFTADYVAPEFIVEGVIQRGRLYTLTAPTGHGKTSAMLYLSCAIATGEDFCGQECEQGDVLFLAGENPDDVRARVIAALEFYQIDPGNLRLHFIAGTFSIRQDMERLKAAAAKLDNLILIVVDTFAAYFDGDNENDNAQALDFARLLRGLTDTPSKPCVIMPAHPVKDAKRANLIPKGGSSLLNEVDGNLTIWNTDGVLEMHWQGKIRGQDFEALCMELEKYESDLIRDRKDRRIPTILAKPVMTLRAMELSAKTVSVETKILQSISVRPDLPQRERAVELALTRASLRRAIDRLLKRKWLRPKGRKLVLTEQGEEALQDGLSGFGEAENDV